MTSARSSVASPAVHSAVVAEWESQFLPSDEGIGCWAGCTPLSWRSGSLNDEPVDVTDAEVLECTPLSWRSGSLNDAVLASYTSKLGALRCRGGVGVSISVARPGSPTHQPVHSAVVAEWESQFLDSRQQALADLVHSAVVAEWESQLEVG